MSVTTDELAAGLDEVFDSKVSIRSRAPYVYRSSFGLEELDVNLADGRALNLIFKDIGRESMTDEARRLKPVFLYEPLREIRTYQNILEGSELGAPKLYGAIVDSRIPRYWLFLEKVPGVELYQVGELETWHQVVRWLATLHDRFSPRAADLADTVPFVRHSRVYYRVWLDRAGELLKSRDLEAVETTARLIDRCEKAIDRIARLPVTLIHGEFYPSNILIDSSGPELRVSVVDWEMAGIGSGLMDLAALVSGQWSEDERRTLVMAYFSARQDLSGDLDLRKVTTDLECCRLYLAVQWLGWFGKRQPYWEHRHDWLDDVFQLADRIV